MKSRFYTLFFIILISNLFQMQCSVPHRVMPQKDIQASDLNEPILDKKVLVASRHSEFKEAIINKLRVAFQDEPVYIKFIGLRDLKKEKAAEYDAVVMLNKCMAWQMDRNINNFLQRHKNHNNMIVLTTSGDGEWLPKMKGRNFDTISSASEKTNVDEVAGKIISKIDRLLENMNN